MKNLKFKVFFMLLFVSIIFTGCPAQFYYVRGSAKIAVVNENEIPFKKGEASRFEVFNMGGFFDDCMLTPENDANLTYKFPLAKAKLKSASRGKLSDPEKNTIIKNLMNKNGILIVDKNGEYESSLSILKNAKYKEINDDTFELECVVILKKK